MSEESKAEGIWEEGDVASSELLQATAAGADLETWRDAILIAAMFDFHGLARAIHVITRAGGLGYLLSMPTPDLLALGLSPAEAGRFESLPDLASHLLAFRYKGSDPATRRDLANELVFRGIHAEWDEDRLGVVGWGPDGRRVLDRVLDGGICGWGAHLNMRPIIQLLLRAGATAVTLWRWTPGTRIAVSATDQAYADELRVAASMLQFSVEDVLLVCPGESVSMAILGQWPR
jgi:hypothetical protein